MDREDIERACNKALFYIKNGLLKVSKCKINGYQVVKKENNRALWKLLEPTGLFEFHETNKTKTVFGWHEVVAYLNFGYKAYINGFRARKGEIEVHHLDSNKQNNHPDNLIYVTPYINHLAAQAVREGYQGEYVEKNVVCFNKQGKLVKDVNHYFKWIIALTVKLTLENDGFSTIKRITISIRNGLMYIYVSTSAWFKLLFSSFFVELSTNQSRRQLCRLSMKPSV